jgi:hypothetical protein
VTSAGVVTTLAGIGMKGFADGPVLSAQFYFPNAVWVDGRGGIYVLDETSHRLRKLTQAPL